VLRLHGPRIPTLAWLSGSVAIAASLLVGCSTKKEVRACPKVEVVGDLSHLVKFANGPGRDLSDVAYVARIQDVKSGCVYDKRGVSVDMIVSIVGERARAGAKLKSADIQYFVAITDGSQNIIEKKIFTSRLDLTDDSPHIDDELGQIIPLSAPPGIAPNAGDHTIIVGFQLTPEEIDYNQKSKATTQ
jgi:hypothetical protein